MIVPDRLSYIPLDKGCLSWNFYSIVFLPYIGSGEGKGELELNSAIQDFIKQVCEGRVKKLFNLADNKRRGENQITLLVWLVRR